MRDPQKDTATCVVCDNMPQAKDLYEENSEVKTVTAGPTKDTAKVKNTSDLLGEYLLKGWKMLNKACVNCYTPIMQSRSGEEICVQCDLVASIPKEQLAIVETPTEIKQVPSSVTDLLNETLSESARHLRSICSKDPAQSKLILENMHSIVALLKLLEKQNSFL